MTQHSHIRTLIEKAKAGERDAFDELVRTCEGRLRSSVERQLGPGTRPVEVDEVIQETFVLAYQAIHRFTWRGEAFFHAWLSRIARNVLIDHAKNMRRSRYLELPDQLSANGSSPSRVLRRGERFDRLQKAIDQLPADYREVIRLSQLQQLKLKDIAGRIGRSEYAVKHLLARALRTLRDSMGDTESLNLPDRPLQVEGDDRGEP